MAEKRNEPLGLERILMALFGGMADKQHERDLEYYRRTGKMPEVSIYNMPPDPNAPKPRDPMNRISVRPLTEPAGMPGQDYIPFPSQAMESPPIDDQFVDPAEMAPPPDPWLDDWAAFKALNPNLDYDAVARQAGGNVPGGAYSDYSETPDTRPEAQSDQAFYDWVDEFKKQNRLNEMMDPRANTYDPEMARAMLTHEVGMGRNAADELYSMAQMARADAEMKKAWMMGGKSDVKASTGQMQDAIDILMNETVDENSRRELVIAKLLVANGQVKEANEILTRVLGPREAEQATEGGDLEFSGGKLR